MPHGSSDLRPWISHKNRSCSENGVERPTTPLQRAAANAMMWPASGGPSLLCSPQRCENAAAPPT
eukprot:13756966-Alexandrium_andersonii.AAC.1